jgi:methyl-accepting chemotaxis protein
MAGAIQDLQKSAEETSKGLRELGSHADGIGRVMGLISDIADQTNLLSLNASIEAARAGDAGRGFTVVAGEVRKLAEKTMQATRAVTEAVTQIQKETRSSVSTMGETARAVDESMVLARKAGDALTNIRLIVGRNSSLAANIASASKQQSTTFDHIVRTNEEVNSIVNSSLDQMERASGSMEELSEQIQQINTLIGELRQKQ